MDETMCAQETGNSSELHIGPNPISSSESTMRELYNDFERLKTFPLIWKAASFNKFMLASGGFYYSGRDYICICAFCNVNLNASQHSITECNLEQIHKIISPNCNFANRGRTENVEVINFARDNRYELHRLISFLKVNWTAPVGPYDLAKWGFFYLGTSDMTRCHFCHLEVVGWEQGDLGDAQHERWNSACPFLRGREVANIPLGQQRNVRSCVANAENARSFNNCKYLHKMKSKPFVKSKNGKNENKADESNEPLRKKMKSNPPKLFEEIERLKTFPKTWKQFLTKPLLASSGFFYSGNNYDFICTCAFCEVSLDASAYDTETLQLNASSFSVTETLQAIHLSLSPNCEMANGRTTHNVALGIERDFSIEEHRLASLLSSDWSAPVDVYDLAKLGLYYVGPGDTVKCFSCTVVFHTWKQGACARALHQHCNPLCPFLLGSGADNLQQEHNNIIISTAGPSNTIARTIQLSMPAQGPVLGDLRGLHCRFCLHSAIGAVLVPCGDMAACIECAPNVIQCPICTRLVTSYVRAYTS